MRERKEHNNRNNLRDEKTGKGYGMQGIDKAPGEETSQHEEKIVADTQKAKGKVVEEELLLTFAYIEIVCFLWRFLTNRNKPISLIKNCKC